MRLFLLTLLICFHAASGQMLLDSAWSRVLGTDQDEVCVWSAPLDDQGIMIVGRTWSESLSNWDVYLIRLDSDGDTIWTRTFGTPLHDEVGSALLLDDGSIVICASIYVWLANDWSNFALFKCDSNGDSLWSRVYSSAGKERCNDVELAADGGFLLVGHSRHSGEWYGRAEIKKVDENGQPVWNLRYGQPFDQSFNSIVRNPTGGYVACGSNPSESDQMFWVVSIDEVGDLVWTREFGGAWSNDGSVKSIITGQENSFFVAGWKRNGGNWPYGYLAKIDSTGDIVWERTYSVGQYSLIETCISSVDGGFVLGGYVTTLGSGGADYYLIKTNSNGFVQGSMTYGETGDDFCKSISQFPDGSLAILGFSRSFGAGGADIWLIRTHEWSSIGDVNVIPRDFDVSVYPNPFNSTTVLQFDLKSTSRVKIDVYSIDGRLVAQIADEVLSAGAHKFPIGYQINSSGVYFAVVQIGARSHIAKLVMIK